MTVAELERSLEADRPLVEAVIGRPLRRNEQAIDVLRLDQALNAAKDDLEAAIRREMIRATGAWLSGHAIRPLPTLTDEMTAILDRLHTLGRQEAELELERLGYTGIRNTNSMRRFAAAPGPDNRDVEGYVKRNLSGIGLRIENDLLTVDLAGASQAAIAHALLEIPGARDIASRVISTALINGLGETWTENADLVTAWEYTAVLDGGTCEACAPLDGTIYATLDELFVVLPDFGPNPDCYGEGRCRCRAVPAEADPNAVPPPPPPPDPTLEDLNAPAWVGELAALRAAPELERLARSLPGFGERFTGDLTAAEKLAALERDGIVNLNGQPPTFSGAAQMMTPGPTTAAAEASILRAGELVETEIDRRLAELPAAVGKTQERLAAIEADHATARTNYGVANDASTTFRRAAEREESDLLAAIRAEKTAAGMDAVDSYRAARQDPRYLDLAERNGVERGRLQMIASERLKVTLEFKQQAAAIQETAQAIYRETLLEALDAAGVRMGPAGDGPAWAYSTKGVRGQAKQLLEKAAGFYPSRWIERGRVNAIDAKWRPNGRGYHKGFTSSPSELVVSGGSRSKLAADEPGFATAIHELGHHLEHVDSRIKALEWAFYQRRTRELGYGAQERDLRFPRGAGYGAHETFRPDGFTEKYMGKTYGNGIGSSYEILTMGLEALWTGSYPLDPEMRRFIIGLLATL